MDISETKLIARSSPVIQGEVQGSMFKFETVEVNRTGQFDIFASVMMIVRTRPTLTTAANYLCVILTHLSNKSANGKNLELTKGNVIMVSGGANWTDRNNSQIWFSMK